jgi:hypothetical protein
VGGKCPKQGQEKEKFQGELGSVGRRGREKRPSRMGEEKRRVRKEDNRKGQREMEERSE